MTADDKLTEEQRRRVEDVVPRVLGLARALAPRMSHVSLEELQSAGYEGLVQAALRYQPEEGVPFGAFAHYRIRGAMLDLARRAAPEIRRRSRAVRTLEATQALLEQAQKGMPAPGGLDPRTLQERVAAAAEIVAQTTVAVVLSKAAPRDPDTVLSSSADAESWILDREQHEALQAVLEDCSSDDRALIDALYDRGLSMGEYANEIGRNKSTVSRLHAKLLGRLAKRMRRRGDRDSGPHPGPPPRSSSG